MLNPPLIVQVFTEFFFKKRVFFFFFFFLQNSKNMSSIFVGVINTKPQWAVGCLEAN